ncbi:hypothetical protein BH11VER1_BH11VER1_04430 [soil metagenome]
MWQNATLKPSTDSFEFSPFNTESPDERGLLRDIARARAVT